MEIPRQDPAARITRRGVGLLAGAALTSAALGPAAPRPSAQTTGAPAERDSTDKAPRRPNILVITADDLGWKDLSCYGSDHIATPNLDRLAAGGVRFSQGYSTGAVCSPTRFALYTGQYPARLRGGLIEPIKQPHPEHGLPPGHPTLASLLADAGYTTAMHGKWHCGYLPWYSPLRSGWQEFFGNFAGSLDYYSKVNHHGEHDLYEGEEPVQVPGYYTDILTDRTVEFLRRDHERPWLLNLNYNAAHWPWERRGDTDVSRRLTERARNGDSTALSHQDGGSLAIYREMIEALDEGIGRIINTLRRTGQERDTLVLFFSDNGGERFSQNWPLFADKGALYEGGIRVPTILRWPAGISGNQVNDTPVASQDWTATLLEAAGARVPTSYQLDGTSLFGHLVRGERAPKHDLFWRTRVARALRRDKWKYLRTRGPNGPEDKLFDLSTDLRERANLSATHPDVLAALRRSWEKINADLLSYG